MKLLADWCSSEGHACACSTSDLRRDSAQHPLLEARRAILPLLSGDNEAGPSSSTEAAGTARNNHDVHLKRGDYLRRDSPLQPIMQARQSLQQGMSMNVDPVAVSTPRSDASAIEDEELNQLD